MKARITVAAVFLPIIIIVLIFLPPLALPIFISAVSAIAVHDVLWSTKFITHMRLSFYTIAVSCILPFWMYFGSSRTLAIIALFIYVMLLFLEALFDVKRITFEKICGAFFVSIIIPLFLSSFIRIADFEYGRILALIPFITAFGSDGGALFVGMKFGKHKFAPNISPKKSVEGIFGGLLGSIILMLIYSVIIRYALGIPFDGLLLVVYSIIGSIVAQIGDLSFSFIKRQYGIKDFGNMLPGHGGMLDRFDSVIFAAPMIEILLLYLPIITR